MALVALVLQLHHYTPHARDFFELFEGIRGEVGYKQNAKSRPPRPPRPPQPRKGRVKPHDHLPRHELPLVTGY